MEKNDHGWWLGRASETDQTGAVEIYEGFFPKNYVKPISEEGKFNNNLVSLGTMSNLVTR